METSLDVESTAMQRAYGGVNSVRSLASEDDFRDLVGAALEDQFKPGLKARIARRFGSKASQLNELDKRAEDERAAVDNQALVKRVMGTSGGDNAQLSRKIRERYERAGVKLPSVEVRFRNLTLSSAVPLGSDKGLFTVAKDLKIHLLKCIGMLTRQQPPMKEVHILRGVSGVLKPGRLTLLVGPPAGGKSLLMKALCNAAHLQTGGEVTYNGHTFDEFNATRTARYVPQVNVHNAQLTVRETLTFSSLCQGAGYRRSLVTLLEEREAEQGITPDPDVAKLMHDLTHGKSDLSVELTLQLLSLVNCADTIVGDGQTRGVSGGEKKRVTTGEMLVGPSKVLFMDEISTGLDSASTFTIVQSLSNWAHATNSTIVVSLLQPEPQTYDVFDDVMVMAEGRIIYHGAREDVPGHFASIGFEPTGQKAIADFLQEIVSPKDQPHCRVDPQKLRPDLAYVPPSVFAEAFERTPIFQRTLATLSKPFDKSTSHPAALMKSKYGAPAWDLLKALTWREIILLKRGRQAQYYRWGQMVLLAFVTGTLFLRSHVTNAKSVRGCTNALGAIFFSLAYNQFLGLAECAAQLQRLPVFFKQRANLFHPGWTWAIPLIAVKVPVYAFEATYWAFFVYWVVGLEPNAGRFFDFWATLVLLQIYSSSLFRLIGSAVRAVVTGVTISVLVMFLALLGTGFVLPRTLIPGWGIWLYWLSPLQYTLSCFANNEFGGHRYNFPVTDIGVEPYFPGQTLGQYVLRSFSVPEHNYYRWLGPLLLIGWAIIFNLLHMLVLQYVPPASGPPPSLPPSTEDEIVEAQGEKGAKNVEAAGGKVPPSEVVVLHASSGDNDASGEANAASTGEITESDKALAVTPQDGGHVALEIKGSADEPADVAIPFKPVTLAFADVHYFVPNPKGAGELELLKGVYGCFRPGVLTALMGSSGAGKSTLMDVLTDRKTVGRITGKVTVNGFDKVPDDFARISGYCEQFDTHSAGATVEEAVRFSAGLRLPRDVSPEQHERFVQQTMDIVELHPIAHSIVGMPGLYGLSGEQFKRLTIAVELVANPSIMFMDEPTSGLDARAAQIVMRVVRNIVNSNRTIVCTIHQPNAEIFFAFDEVLLLKRGGWTIYNGPLSGLVEHFEGVEGVKKISPGANPATYMLEVSTQAEEERLGVNFADIYKERKLPEMINMVEPHLAPHEGDEPMRSKGTYATGFTTQYKLLLGRMSKSYWRNPPYNTTRLLLTVLAGLIAGAFYWGKGDKYGSVQHVQSVEGALFICLVFLGSKNLQMVIPVFSFERPPYYRERAARMYSPWAWMSSMLDVELPYITVQACVFSLISYLMIHFQFEAARFFFFVLVIWVTLAVYTYLGMLTVALTPNVVMGVTLGAALQGLWILFAGFLIPKPSMPQWWRWYYYLSPPSWSIYALVSDQLGDKTGHFLALPSGGNISVSDYVKDVYDYRYHLRWMAVGILFAFFFAMRFSLIIAVRYLNYQNR